MAGDDSDSQDLTEATHEPRECMACRGTGRVISNLGGSPKQVPCPWCEGSGMRPAELDAQSRWREQQDRQAEQRAESEDDAGDGGEPAGEAAGAPSAGASAE